MKKKRPQSAKKASSGEKAKRIPKKTRQDPRLTVKTTWESKKREETEHLRKCWIASGGDPDVFRTGIKGLLPDRTREATSKGRVHPEPAAPISEEERRVRQLSLQVDNIAGLLKEIEEGLQDMRPKSPEQWPSLEEEF
jgi:hypothetical protein